MCGRRPVRLAVEPGPDVPEPGPAAYVGVEHEFRVTADGLPCDFRRLLHTLPVPGRRMDPGDPNAYRCAWGGVLTSDGPEAEIAIPPVAVRPDFARAVDQHAAIGTTTLRGLLPDGHELEGYSTHLSTTILHHQDRLARLYADTFGPALMLLMDRATSPGLLVRPRPGRIELCGEHVDGAHLRAVAAFAAGSTRALAHRRRPPRLEVVVAPAVGRYGYYVDRSAFGIDLYTEGRAARLRRDRGGTIIAQDHLELCWQIARASLAGEVSMRDLVDADAVVAGCAPVPCEEPRPRPAPADRGTTDRLAPHDRLHDRLRPRFSVRTTVAVWDFTLFRVAGARAAYACVPRDHLDAFLDRLDRGMLDAEIEAFLAAAPRGLHLQTPSQTRAAALYDTIAPPADLLLREPTPLGGWGGGATGERRDKQRRHPRPHRTHWRAFALAGAIVVAIAVAGGLALAAGGGDDGSGRAASDDAGAGREAGPDGNDGRSAPIRRAGPASAPMSAVQDGTFRYQATQTVAPERVAPGGSFTLTQQKQLTGPDWTRNSAGAWEISCAGDDVTSNFTPVTSVPITFVPFRAHAGDAVRALVEGGAAPRGAVAGQGSSTTGDTQSTTTGCDRTSTNTSTITITAPLTLARGEYVVFAESFILRQWPNGPKGLTLTSGELPTIVVDP